MLMVTSTAFGNNKRIPKKYTGEGENVSPPLSWKVDENAVEYALICDDPDAPRDEPWVHWVAYNIPATVNSIAEGHHRGATQGNNTADRKGYTGPMPPPGHGVHHYRFKVYALDTLLGLKEGADKHELLRAMEGHIVDEGELVGTYER
jgi:Raf kinase inhibitor-like YbhB/YbcL family protein